MVPAPFIRISTSPRSRRIFFFNNKISSFDLKSTWYALAETHISMRISAVFWAAARSLSATATLQPWLANWMQICLPIPPAPPVTLNYANELSRAQLNIFLVFIFTRATFPRISFGVLHFLARRKTQNARKSKKPQAAATIAK